MEIICRIADQLPLQTRQYTDRNGQPQTFNAIGFLLASGSDTLYAELTGDQALRQSQQQPLDRNFYYKADLTTRSEQWADSNGEARYATRIYINRIAQL